jgi:hypothetical protein
MKRLSIAALGLLAACGTPQEQCISRNTRDLRVVDRLISETQTNISRGYALEEVTVFETVRVPCPPTAPGGPAGPGFCYDQRPDTDYRPRAIDLNAEAAKLESLKVKRESLARASEQVIAACRASYPE